MTNTFQARTLSARYRTIIPITPRISNVIVVAEHDAHSKPMKEIPNEIHPDGLCERSGLAPVDKGRERTLVGRLQSIHGSNGEGGRTERQQRPAAHLGSDDRAGRERQDP